MTSLSQDSALARRTLELVDIASPSHDEAQVYLYGWTGDFGDPDDFDGVFFRSMEKQWGFNNPAIFNILTKARDESNLAKRTALYKQANNMIMNFLPGVPYVHTSPALAFAKNVHGYVPSPVDVELFSSGSIR